MLCYQFITQLTDFRLVVTERSPYMIFCSFVAHAGAAINPFSFPLYARLRAVHSPHVWDTRISKSDVICLS